MTRGDPHGAEMPADFSWDVLDVTSSCGIVVVIMSLSWWGRHVMAGGVDPAKVQEWRHAVMEVAYAFEQLLKLKEANDGVDSGGSDSENENGGPEGMLNGKESVATSTKRKRGCAFLLFLYNMNLYTESFVCLQTRKAITWLSTTCKQKSPEFEGGWLGCHISPTPILPPHSCRSAFRPSSLLLTLSPHDTASPIIYCNGSRLFYVYFTRFLLV